jgi:hypothetical protein
MRSVGTELLQFFFFLAAFVAYFLAACATVELTGPPPKHDAGLYGNCPSDPIIECEAGPPGDDQACATVPEAGGYREQIPAGRSYPGGCVVDFPDPLPLKATGECKLLAQCTCTDPLVPGASAWTCLP